MKELIKSRISFIIAIVGLLGGLIWVFLMGIEPEPVILLIVSFFEVLGYFLLPNEKEISSPVQNINSEQNLSLNLNINHPLTNESKEKTGISIPKIDRTTILNTMCNQTSILFIDDDSKFNVVKILKDSGWKKTKTVVDIKNLDVNVIRQADIIFVDINGIGKILKLEYEGLDLALMLKQKYPDKKVIIYSANRNSNSFHQAWDLCDFKLEKNALPYQFQNLVEEYSIEKYNREK